MIPQNIFRRGNRSHKRRYLILGMLLWAMVAHATPMSTNEWYHIDIIVFSQLTSSQYQREIWPTPAPLPNLEDAHKLIDPVDAIHQTSAYVLLPDNQFNLSSELKRLQNNKNYHVIWYGAWQQPIYKGRAARQPIYLSSKSIYSITAEQVDSIQTEVPALAGLITLKQVNPYITVKANLRLTEPVSDLPGKTKGLFTHLPVSYQQFALQQTQRLRPNEIHYFDHPLFGMLIKITPYKPKAIALEPPSEQSLMTATSTNQYVIEP